LVKEGAFNTVRFDADPDLIGNYAETETLIQDLSAPIPYETGNEDEEPGNVPNYATVHADCDIHQHQHGNSDLNLNEDSNLDSHRNTDSHGDRDRHTDAHADYDPHPDPDRDRRISQGERRFPPADFPLAGLHAQESH